MFRAASATSWVSATALAVLATVTLGSPSPAAAPPPRPAPANDTVTGAAPPTDLRTEGPDYHDGKPLPLDRSSLDRARRRAAQPLPESSSTPEVGDTRTWLALEDPDSIYLKDFTLRAIGDHVQVWVADDLAFPQGDCRNDLGLTEVTDSQVQSFVHEFDTRIYPTESRAFSRPRDRDGTRSTAFAHSLGLPGDYWKVGAAQSDDVVTLVDNVRDANFYAPSTPDGQTYIAGFFYSEFSSYLDRNVMTVDAFDWEHHMGASPPDDSGDPAYRACTQELGQGSGGLGAARPHAYEGVFAHEYQHLLEHYRDPDEATWVNEGLSDWAQSLLGYVDASIPPDDRSADGQISCFQGFQESYGGPENSLTEWGDQGSQEIMCDYGAAYTFMEYLHSHYGDSFMKALHRNTHHGLEGLSVLLRRYGAGVTAQETLHRWAAAAALDQVLDRNGNDLEGGDPTSFTASGLSAKIGWDTHQAYDSPGAPPNGSDYVQLRDRRNRPLKPRRIGTIRFAGSPTLAPAPVEWAKDSSPPTSVEDSTTCGQVRPGYGAAALYSGCGPDLDRSLVRPVTVPDSGGSLTFDALWDIEQGWDFGYVQVSADGGRTWQSLPTQDTTAVHAPDAQDLAVANLPGFNGSSDGWRAQTASLDRWKGQQILVGFRYITDAEADEAGFWVRNIDAAGTALPSTLDGWQTITQAHPTPVGGWTVQLVSYSNHGQAHIHRLRINKHHRGHVIGAKVRKALGRRAKVVGAIVTYDDPTESSTQYARYRLRVNGVTQPGG